MLEIRYISPPNRLTRIYGDPLYIDTSGTEQLAISKAVDRGDITQITQEAALGISLPATPKNKAIFEQFFPDTVNKQTGFISVEVKQNGEVLPLTGLTILEFDGQNFEGEFFGDDWLESLKEILISDLDLGTYEFTAENILTSWEGDRQQLAMPIVADWGKFGTDQDNEDGPGAGKIQTSDVRFVFNISLLLSRIFCALSPAWSFQSSYFDQGPGRYQYLYLSGDRFYDYSGKEDQYFVSLDLTTPTVFAAEETFFPSAFNEVQDDDNVYNDVGILPNAYILATAFDYDSFDISFEIKNLVVTLPPPPPGEHAYTFTFSIFQLRGFSPDFLDYLHKETIIGSADQEITKTISFNFSTKVSALGTVFGFSLSYQNKAVIDGSYSTFTLDRVQNIYIRPSTPRYIADSTITLSEIIDPELDARSLVESLAHCINAKFVTDYSSRTVHLFPPDRFTDGETVIEGFYQNSAPLDLRANTIENGISFENKETTRERFISYRFKDGDAYISSIQGENRFNRTVDLGTGENKTLEVENPLIVGTGELEIHADYTGGTGDIVLPVMWDNDTGNLSYSVGVRLLTFYGMLTQEDGDGITKTWQFEDEILDTVPYFSQVPSIELPDDLPLVAITFSSGYNSNLYDLFYRQETGCNAVLFKILLTGGDALYNSIDFRKKLLIQGETSAFEVTPTAVHDHITSSRVPLLLEARPA